MKKGKELMMIAQMLMKISRIVMEGKILTGVSKTMVVMTKVMVTAEKRKKMGTGHQNTIFNLDFLPFLLLVFCQIM